MLFYRGLLTGIHEVLYLESKNLLGEGSHLALVSRILEKHKVERIELYGAMIIPFMEHI